MKRVATVLVATAVGLGLVFGYHPHTSVQTALPPAVSLSSKANSAGAITVVGTDQPLSGGLGDLQVKLTVANGKILGVGLAQLNVHGPQSAQITNSVIPQLEQQTMAAQGGPIHGVSGATYTSQAYATSLQAALDKAAAAGGANAALATGHGNGSVLLPQGGHDD
jgi:uncharacterized protein with FMN-binding domain